MPAKSIYSPKDHESRNSRLQPWRRRRRASYVTATPLVLLVLSGGVPASLGRQNTIRLGRSPGVGFVLVEGTNIPQDRINHAPCGLDRVLARKEGRVSVGCITQKSFV